MAGALNLRHVLALAQTVRSGSISGAASAVGMSQPALTQAIARLEAATGVKLLERGPGGVTPTDGGILFAARAEAAQAALAAAYQPFRKGGIGGRSGAERDLTAAQAQALIALADGGSYVAAAAASGFAQPSLHRAIGDLERSCGVALIERQGRNVALTEAGQRLARACRLAIAELDAATDELAVLAGRDQGTLRVAAAAGALARLLPNTVAHFLQLHKPVTIELVEAGADAGDRLRDGRLDALLAAEPAEGFAPGLLAEPLMDESFAVLARAGHPLSAATAGLVRLATFSWVLPPPGSDERRLWEGMFLAGGLYPPAVSVTCPSAAACLDIAAASDMLTVASTLVARASDLAALAAPLPHPRRELALVTRTGWFPTPAQAAFLDEVRSAAAALDRGDR